MPATSTQLKRIAKKIILTLFKVKKKERVLIITNPKTKAEVLCDAIAKFLQKNNFKFEVVKQGVKNTFDFMDAKTVAAIKRKPQVIIAALKKDIGKDRKAQKKPYAFNGKEYHDILKYLLAKREIRLTKFYIDKLDNFLETMDIDYRKSWTLSEKIYKKFCLAKRVLIISKLGTNLAIDVENRKVIKVDGNLQKMGKKQSFPSGEIYISPTPYKTQGIAIFDGSFYLGSGKTLLIKDPVKMEIENGIIKKISGNKEAKIIKKLFIDIEKRCFEFEKQGKIAQGRACEFAKNSMAVGEVAIGFNKKARIRGSIVEDEKCYGTSHIAFGRNRQDLETISHLDTVFRDTKVVLEYKNGKKETILKNHRIFV